MGSHYSGTNDQDEYDAEPISWSDEEYAMFISGAGQPSSLYSTDGDMSSISGQETLTQQDQMSPRIPLSTLDERTFEADRDDFHAWSEPSSAIQSPQPTTHPLAGTQYYIDPKQISTLNYQLEPTDSAMHPDTTSYGNMEPQMGRDTGSNSSHRVSKSSRPKHKGPVRCPRLGCSNVYPRNRELNRHLKTHDKQWPCKCCTRSFATERDAERHENTRHPDYVEMKTGKRPKRIPCSRHGCRKTFARPDHLKRHLDKFH